MIYMNPLSFTKQELADGGAVKLYEATKTLVELNHAHTKQLIDRKLHEGLHAMRWLGDQQTISVGAGRGTGHTTAIGLLAMYHFNEPTLIVAQNIRQCQALEPITHHRLQHNICVVPAISQMRGRRFSGIIVENARQLELDFASLQMGSNRWFPVVMMGA